MAAASLLGAALLVLDYLWPRPWDPGHRGLRLKSGVAVGLLLGGHAVCALQGAPAPQARARNAPPCSHNCRHRFRARHASAGAPRTLPSLHARLHCPAQYLIRSPNRYPTRRPMCPFPAVCCPCAGDLRSSAPLAVLPPSHPKPQDAPTPRSAPPPPPPGGLRGPRLAAVQPRAVRRLARARRDARHRALLRLSAAASRVLGRDGGRQASCSLPPAPTPRQHTRTRPPHPPDTAHQHISTPVHAHAPPRPRPRGPQRSTPAHPDRPPPPPRKGVIVLTGLTQAGE
jgi:hypothetical protein